MIMKKLAKISALLFTVVLIATGCKKLPEFTDGSSSTPVTPTVDEPTVTTIEMTEINATYAICGGSVVYSGSSELTAVGFCWSENTEPTISDNHSIESTSAGSFVGKITNLTPHTKYYIRAYATNANGTYYGNVLSFTTLYDYNNITVETLDATNITATNAVLHGIAECPPGETYFAGFYYSTDLQGSYYTADCGELPEGGGEFSCTITGLEPNTTYQFKAMAFANGYSSTDGEVMVFKTLTAGGGSGDVPTGAINGLFSVSDTKQVYFSKGNLQYKASTNTWRFAENQWDYVGFGEYAGNVYENGIKCDNNMISSSYSGWIDLFGWGTSGYNHGAVCYQPWSTSENNNDYLAYGYSMFNLYSESGQADWGYNPISNGGNTENQWRCLTKEQAVYLFNERSTASGYRYARAVVTNLEGIILLPDDWDSSIYNLNNVNLPDSNPDDNTISEDIWNGVFEANGAVFLPPTGHRTNTTTSDRYVGSYWTSSNFSSIYDNLAYGINNGTALLIGTGGGYCCRGNAVRLVHDAN